MQPRCLYALIRTGLHHHNSARVLVALEWIGAVCGSVFAAVSDLNAPMTTKIELCIFLSMGGALAVVWNLVVEQFSFPALCLLGLGGAAYLAGIPFFLMGEVDPKYHVIWHLFVIAGASLHWFFTYFFVLDTDIGMNFTNETSVSAMASAAVSMMIDNARNMTKL
jgi:channel protein (hemolysin III family)